jgi:HlyD family secretion protein
MNRRVLAAIAVVLALAVAAWWFFLRPVANTEWQGYAEADFVKVGPTQQGMLTAVSVARGSKVAAGAALFTQDDTSDRAARDQAARQLKQAEEQLANLKAPGKPTEITQAQANLADAMAARDKIETDLKRYEALQKAQAIAAQTLDQQRADLRSADAKVDGLVAALTQMRGSMGREGDIKVQLEAAEAARSALAMAQWRLDQRHVSSPADAVVADVLARPGETIDAGVPVVSLLPPKNIFVRFFVPETMLATVHYGDRVALSCDNCPAHFTATISFISPQAEYTPPIIYSDSTRSKLVYMIEARPPADWAALLNPGQPVTVRPVSAPGPS